jgi:putative hydrolase of the HAD superfamily
MKPILLFDLGGVLADLGSPSASMELPFGDDRFWRTWLHSPHVRAYELGQIGEDEALPAIARDLGLGDPGTFARTFKKWRLSLYPGVEPLIEDLSDEFELALLSNTNAFHWEQVSSSTTIFDRFAGIFLSYETGVYKPNAEAFEYVIGTLGRRPGDIVFLDDTRANIEAARRVGINAFQATGPKSVIDCLSTVRR